jgi:glycosyltransferase involved in cell wall biosynthesis
MKDTITPLILTFNEAPNIQRTLENLTWAKQIVVVDSYSTDETVKLASNFPNVTVVQRAFDTHSDQWNFGLDQVKTEWVLSLDADYEVPTTLRDEIVDLAPDDEMAGYFACFEYRIFGHPLRASVYPPRVILFRRARARYVADGHTQLLTVNGPVGRLRSLVYHDDRKPLSHWLQSQDRYAKIESQHLLSTPVEQLSFQDRLRRKIFFAAPAMFLYLLFGRGLILDGWPGWLYVAQRTIAELLLSIRLLTETKKLEDRR